MSKTLDIDKVSEDIDYKLVPVEDSPNDQAWDVRILRGEFVETVIRFGNVAYDGINDCLKFNFMVIYSPDNDTTSEDVKLQGVAANILHDILDKAYAEGWLHMEEKN
jgi:hypothetical protein